MSLLSCKANTLVVFSILLLWRHLTILKPTMYMPKPSRKIESINKTFCFDIENGLRNIFLGIKLHQDRKLKLSESVWKRISWKLTNFQFNQTTHRKNEKCNFQNKLNELKFCEVSQNSISNTYWKFQLCILKKKVLLIKRNC